VQPLARPFSAITVPAGVQVEAEQDLERRFDAFVNDYRDRAVRIAWRLLGGDAAAAEDVAQEAFTRAYRGLARFRDDAKLSTWFYRILVNEVRRHQRWRALRLGGWAEDRDPDTMPDPRAGSGAARSDPGLRRRIGAAIAALPRGQREAFVLVHLEELTLAEAATATGRALGTMKSHLHRALVNLRGRLADLAPAADRSAKEKR
jgi:RNA polymerase sigma-70 factor, ECF subfamily